MKYATKRPAWSVMVTWWIAHVFEPLRTVALVDEHGNVIDEVVPTPAQEAAARAERISTMPQPDLEHGFGLVEAALIEGSSLDGDSAYRAEAMAFAGVLSNRISAELDRRYRERTATSAVNRR